MENKIIDILHINKKTKEERSVEGTKVSPPPTPIPRK